MTATPPARVIHDRYELRRALGRGASSVVHLAFDRAEQQYVSLKRIDLTQLELGHRTVGRLDLAAREALVTASSSHEHVVRIHRIVEDAGEVWIVMDYVAGGTLADRIAASRGPLDVAFLARVGAEVADALGTLHARGIIHRDIKPANILLEADGSARLADFGVASALDAWTLGVGSVGTRGYMAPEVRHEAPATPASDVYSLAATLYTGLTGVTPEQPEPSAPESGGRVARLVVRALDADPNRRPDAAELRDGLLGAKETPPTLVGEPWGQWEDPATTPPSRDEAVRHVVRRPRPALAAVAVAAVLLVVLGLNVFGSDGGQPLVSDGAPPPAMTSAAPPPPSPVDTGTPPSSVPVDRWKTFWAEAWYSPFGIFRWAYDDSVPADAGFFRGLWWLVRLGVALVSAVLLDIPLSLAYVSAAIAAVLVGPGPAHVLVGPFLLLWLGFLLFRFLD